MFDLSYIHAWIDFRLDTIKVWQVAHKQLCDPYHMVMHVCEQTHGSVAYGVQHARS
jgi:hypothetical protein